MSLLLKLLPSSLFFYLLLLSLCFPHPFLPSLPIPWLFLYLTLSSFLYFPYSLLCPFSPSVLPTSFIHPTTPWSNLCLHSARQEAVWHCDTATESLGAECWWLDWVSREWLSHWKSGWYASCLRLLMLERNGSCTLFRETDTVDKSIASTQGGCCTRKNGKSMLPLLFSTSF